MASQPSPIDPSRPVTRPSENLILEGRMNCARVVLRRAVSPTAALFVAALIATSATTVIAEEHRPRVFITDSSSWEVVGSAAGSGGTFASRTQGGARPQTAEIIKTFGERCQQVLVNNKEGDAIVSRSTRSLVNSVQDACGAIMADWTSHSTATSPLAPGSALLPEPLPTPKLETHSASVTPAAKREVEMSAQPTPLGGMERGMSLEDEIHLPREPEPRVPESGKHSL